MSMGKLVLFARYVQRCIASSAQRRRSQTLCCGHCQTLVKLSSRSASPGKLGEFEEELFRSAEMSETPVVMAVTLALVEGARMVRLRRCWVPRPAAEQQRRPEMAICCTGAVMILSQPLPACPRQPGCMAYARRPGEYEVVSTELHEQRADQLSATCHDGCCCGRWASPLRTRPAGGWVRASLRMTRTSATWRP